MPAMRTLLFAAALALAAGSGCSKADTAQAGGSADKKQAEANVPAMTVDQVDQELAAGKVRAVDCNPDNTRKRMGVVPGAILITDDESFAASELPADKTTKLVFYCMNPG